MTRVLHLTTMFPLSPEGIHSGGHAVYHLVESLRKELGKNSQEVELYRAYWARFYSLVSRRKRVYSVLGRRAWVPYLRFHGLFELPHGWLNDWVIPLWQNMAGRCVRRSVDADLIHVHTPFDLSHFASLLAARYRKPLVITVRREMSRWSEICPRRQRQLREALLRADTIIAPSQCLADRVAEVSGRTSTVIPNGTDRLFDEPPPAGNRRVPTRVLFVGTLDENKAVDLLVRAVRQLVDAGEDVECRIVGAGVLDRPLRQMAAGCERIAFLGKISQEAVREEMRAAQVFCMPSRCETFGIVYGEAMKQGAVVIGRKGTGIDGTGKEGVHCELIRDDEELGPVLRQLLRDPERCARMRSEAMTLARRWAWEDSARDHAAVYRTILGGSPRVSVPRLGETVS